MKDIFGLGFDDEAEFTSSQLASAAAPEHDPLPSGLAASSGVPSDPSPADIDVEPTPLGTIIKNLQGPKLQEKGKDDGLEAGLAEVQDLLGVQGGNDMKIGGLRQKENQTQQLQPQPQPQLQPQPRDLEIEARKRKDRFVMFTRILMKILETNDKELHAKAKAAIVLCAERNKAGDPQYASLHASMHRSLRRVLGETFWDKAYDCLKNFLDIKEGRTYSYAGLSRTSKPSSITVSALATASEDSKVIVEKQAETNKKAKKRSIKNIAAKLTAATATATDSMGGKDDTKAEKRQEVAQAASKSTVSAAATTDGMLTTGRNFVRNEKDANKTDSTLETKVGRDINATRRSILTDDSQTQQKRPGSAGVNDAEHLRKKVKVGSNDADLSHLSHVQSACTSLQAIESRKPPPAFMDVERSTGSISILVEAPSSASSPDKAGSAGGAANAAVASAAGGAGAAPAGDAATSGTGTAAAAAAASDPPGKSAAADKKAGASGTGGKPAEMDSDGAAQIAFASVLSATADNSKVSKYKVGDHDAFMDRFLAFRQYVEMLREARAPRSAKNKWKMLISRTHICRDVLACFGKAKRLNMFQPTKVIFIDKNGNQEEGNDESGLSIEMFMVFSREIGSYGNLFERMSDDAECMYIPRVDAPASELIAFGRILCRCILDDTPVSFEVGPLLLEMLANVHERRSFSSAENALATLYLYDPSLSKMWRRLLNGEVDLDGIDSDFFDDSDNSSSEPVTNTNIAHWIIRGTRLRLELRRKDSWSAIQMGFIQYLDFSIQLAPLATPELAYMVHGRDLISTDDLIAGIKWPWMDKKEEKKSRFEAKGCREVPRYLKSLLEDESIFTRKRRLEFLEWCTSLSVVPASGIQRKICLRLFVGAGEHVLPMTHTCTREVHLPAYNSREQLQEKLLLALDHRWDGFYQE